MFTQSDANEQLVSALGPIFQSMHLTVPELQCSGLSIHRLARIGISEVVWSVENTCMRREHDETDHTIHVHLNVAESSLADNISETSMEQPHTTAHR